MAGLNLFGYTISRDTDVSKLARTQSFVTPTTDDGAATVQGGGYFGTYLEMDATAKSEAIADATSRVTAVIGGAAAAFDTLGELATALGNDASFATTVTNSLAGKVPSATPISQKTASYTLSSVNEKDSMIEMNAAGATTVTIPTDAAVAFPIGTSLDVLRVGAGAVDIAAGAGVTVNATPGLKLRSQWSSATLIKRAANTWVLVGDLSA
jgi:hypothetical protein